MNPMNRIVLCTAASLAAVQGMAQQPFDLDPLFHTPIQEVYVNSIIPLADGKVLVSGRMRFPNFLDDILLARLDVNGARDPDFAQSALGGGMLVPWNDRYYVGTSQTVRRIFPTGLQDLSFIEMNSGPYFTSAQGGDYYVYPDGRVLMSGWHHLNDMARGFVGDYNLIWFSNQGYLDTTAHHRQCDGVIYDFEPLPDGKFICTGVLTEYEGNPTSRVFRVEADGAFDPTFNAPIDNTWGGAVSFLPIDQGKVLAGGFFRRPGETDTLCLLRFLPDGGIDPSFHALQLRHHIYPGAIPDVKGIYPLDAGRYIITGNFDEVDGQVRGAIALIDTAGNLLDDYFAGDGCGPYEWFDSPYQGLFHITPAPDGSYYINGAYHGYDDGHGTPGANQRMVSRLYGLNVGVAEHATDTLGTLQVYPNPASEQVTFSYDLRASSKHAFASIRDVTGREVGMLSMPAPAGQVFWDTRGVAPGTYSVALTNDVERLRMERFVVQR